jgi:putative intracellular protease/amidase
VNRSQFKESKFLNIQKEFAMSLHEFLPQITSFSEDAIKFAALQARVFSDQALQLSAHMVEAGKNVVDQAVQLSGHVVKAGKNTVNALARVIRTTEGLDSLVRFGVDALNVVDLMQGVENATRPFFTTCANMASLISAGRILYSINYIASGKVFKDIADGNALPLLSQAAFLVRRSVVTTDWLINNGLVPQWIEDLCGHVSSQTGAISAFSGLSFIPKNDFLKGTLLAALVPLAVMRAQELMKGEDLIYNIADLANLSLDIALTALGMAGIDDPSLTMGLSAVSASAGLVAAFYNPANNPKK